MPLSQEAVGKRTFAVRALFSSELASNGSASCGDIRNPVGTVCDLCHQAGRLAPTAVTTIRKRPELIPS